MGMTEKNRMEDRGMSYKLNKVIRRRLRDLYGKRKVGDMETSTSKETDPNKK